MSLVINERTKLTAAAINNVAVATIATALIAPAVSFVYGSPGASRLVVPDRFGLVRSGRRPTSYGTGNPREAAIMTNLQLYLLLVPSLFS